MRGSAGLGMLWQLSVSCCDLTSDWLILGCGLDMEVPLASSLLDLALQTVTDKECWVRDEVAVRLAKLAVGRFLEL